MSDPLIQELEDAERNEKMMALWNEYGSYIIAVALLTVLFTGLFSGYHSYRTNINEKQTTSLIAALEADDRSDALDKLSPDLDGGLRAIAELSAAGSYLTDDKPAEAVKIYEQAAKDKNLPENLRDLSSFMAIRIGWDLDSQRAKEERLQTDDEYLQRLKALSEKTDSPWRAHAFIQSAIIKASQGDFDAALGYLGTDLNNIMMPPSLQERAGALRHIYTLELEKQAPAAKDTKEEAQG